MCRTTTQYGRDCQEAARGNFTGSTRPDRGRRAGLPLVFALRGRSDDVNLTGRARSLRNPRLSAGSLAAGLLSVVISPALGLVLLRRERPATVTPRALPAPVMPVLTAEDRALCRASESSSELQGSTR